MSETFPFTPEDRRRLRERGIAEAEALRQLTLLSRPPAWADLVRPCTPGDGIESIDAGRAETLLRRDAESARRDRRVKFVPASGAATRMFRDLLWFHEGEGRGRSWEEIRELAETGHPAARAMLRFREGLPRLPFRERLARALGASGAADPAEAPPAALLEALLAPGKLDCASRPKGLLEFHRYDGGSRTAFEEHLVEAAHYARGGDGRARLHLTVSPEHRDGFSELLSGCRERYGRSHGAVYEVGFSEQDPATDTLAADLEGRPFRDADGGLVLRPGGHGALIRNLDAVDADLVFVKNIDNVQPDRVKPTVVRWKRILAGRLLELQAEVFARRDRLRDAKPPGGNLEEALAFVRGRLGVEPGPAVPRRGSELREWLLDRLDRPLRVCGVVRNTGEPGGGPFWVRGADGTVTLQIVETTQIDPDSGEQQGILRSATHFNPVDLVCAPRDSAGRKYDLERFVDADAVIATRKSAGGRPLRALERPGLWNGAMACWNTVFVEVPLATFSPVKTVLDLLRDEHQPG